MLLLRVATSAEHQIFRDTTHISNRYVSARMRCSRGDQIASDEIHRRLSLGSLLVHITHGPEAPSRAALGVTVAKAAVDAGHRVTLFLAGDAVYLVKDEVIENLQGIGTGALRETLPALSDAGASIFVSGMSSKSRGVTDDDLDGKGIEFAGPPQLVALTFEADRVLCY